MVKAYNGQVLMLIGNLNFSLICPIIPEIDDRGNPLEYLPAANYDNTKRLPLNKWGEGPFCRFHLKTERSELFGVYAIVKENQVVYIGKCTGRTSTLVKRFDNGYGIISPRNCYQGGQSTNCHINHLILETVKAGVKLSLFFYEPKPEEKASNVESKLIGEIKPKWNINEPW